MDYFRSQFFHSLLILMSYIALGNAGKTQYEKESCELLLALATRSNPTAYSTIGMEYVAAGMTVAIENFWRAGGLHGCNIT